MTHTLTLPDFTHERVEVITGRRSGVGSAIPLPRLPKLHGCAGGTHHHHAALLAHRFRVEIDPTRVSMQAWLRERVSVSLETCEGQQSVGTLLTGG